MAGSITHVGGEPAVASWEGEAGAEMVCRVVEPGGEGAGRVETPSGSVYFVEAAGSPVEMARRMGARTAGLVGEGPVPAYASRVARMLRELSGGRFEALADWAMRRCGTDRLARRFREECGPVLEAFAGESPLSCDSLVRAYAMPETVGWLLAHAHRMMGPAGIPGRWRATLGRSSSAVVHPPVAETTYHARNLGGPGPGGWQRAPLVHHYRPDDGLDYVAVAAAGLLGGGVTAMNAAGLTLAAHRHLVERPDLDAVPIGVAGDRVMRRARSLEEAVDLLREHPPVGGCSWVLTEGDTGRVAIYEAVPGEEHLVGPGSEQASLVHTNTFVGERPGSAEIEVFPEARRDDAARRERLRARLERFGAGQGRVGVAEMAELLGDFHESAETGKRLAGRTVAAVDTLSSVVFEPAARRVWVGVGPSPAARGWMVPFRLGGAACGGSAGPDRRRRPFCVQPGWGRTPHGRAFELYRRACLQAEEGESAKRLLIQIEHALALFPEDPAMHLLVGLLALRDGRGRRAEGAFRGGLERLDDPARRAEATLYLGWALDVQGQRASARQMYRSVLGVEAADPRVRRRARAGRWWGLSAARARRLPVDLVHVGAL